MIRHRVMLESDLRTVLGWAAEEGWNPGLEDAAAFLAADPSGFFLAEDDGEPVAAISVVNHSDAFAFLGLYLCRPDYRGRGIGFRLWGEAIRHAGNRTIGLDGVPDQQANYRKSGFVPAGETTRFSGKVTGRTHPDIRPTVTDDLQSLIEMEANASRWRKPRYLTAWLSNTTSRRTLVLQRRGQIEGMATIRKCHTGAKLGPIVAFGEETARALIEHAATLFGDEIVIDAPSTAAGLHDLCSTYGLSPGFSTARMYRGSVPLSDAGFYAVGTLELG